MEGFDFHSLLRKDLQALCKLNKIPANITNVAMADSLQALPQVEGLDELIQTLSSNPQTVPGTPAVSQSARRGSVRRNPIAVVEPETLTRTRRTAAKKVAPQTPATAVSRRKVSVAETSKFDLEAGEEVSSVQTAYSTRRSVRLLGKSMGKMCLKETDVQQIESAAAGADSSIDDSCRNLDSSMQKETDFEGANDEGNSSIKEISDETNDSLMKNELSLDSEDGKDTEQVAADVNHVTDENMESSNPDAVIELNDKDIDSNAEKETGSDERLTVEQQESIVESEPAVLTPPIARPALRSIVVMGSNSHHLHSPAPQAIEDSSAVADTDTETKSEEKTSEGNVEDDNTDAANQLQAPALPVIEDSSAAADAEPESEGDDEDDNMEEVSSFASNQLQAPAPQATEVSSADAETESDEETSEGDVEDDNMEEVSSQLQTPAPQVTEDSSAAADAEPESDEKASEDVNMEEVVPSFAAKQLQEEVVPSARSEDIKDVPSENAINKENIKKEGAPSEFVIKEDKVDDTSVSQDVPFENVINKENMNKKKEELVELSMRQLTKMLKEKLQIKEGGKTEKRQALAENTNKGC